MIFCVCVIIPFLRINEVLSYATMGQLAGLKD